MNYPRERNGWTDDGSPIRASNQREKCPNCGSSQYRETVSMEKCGACGLQCDYWGGGSNAVYDDYLARYHAARASAERKRIKEQMDREWGPDVFDEDDF
jgi:hypothetical protein